MNSLAAEEIKSMTPGRSLGLQLYQNNCRKTARMKEIVKEM